MAGDTQARDTEEMNPTVLTYEQYSEARKKALAEVGVGPEIKEDGSMKQELKTQYAKEVIEYLEGKGVADLDKRKVFSNAYSIIATRTGPIVKKPKAEKKAKK